MRFAEFFAGIGLVRLGLERAGWECVYANDISESKQRIYEANFGSGDFDLRDIADLSGADIPDVDLATASFPCTDLSLAGNRAGLDGGDSGTLWEFTRVLEEMGARRPPRVMLENVTGFLSSHDGKDFRASIQELNGLGYVCDAVVIDAVRFVPQSRPRLFILGRAGVDVSGVPELNVQTPLRPGRLMSALQANADLDWSIGEYGLPERGTRPRFWRVLEDDPAQLNWWPEAKVAKLRGQMSPRHGACADHLVERRKRAYGTVYRRVRHGSTMAELRTDGIAGCLRTPRGGSSRQILFQAGYGKAQARFMTPREYARLQGVPDSFKIVGTTSEALFAFGDAVCVPVIEWLAEHALPMTTGES